MEIVFHTSVLSDGFFTEPDDCSSHNECGPHAECIEGNNYNFTCEWDYPRSGRLCDGKHLLISNTQIFSSFENEDNFQCFKNCFMLRHLVISECGGPPTLLVPGDTLTLQSPGYPVGYEPNMTCEWRFIAPPGYDLVFFLEVMWTEFL